MCALTLLHTHTKPQVNSCLDVGLPDFERCVILETLINISEESAASIFGTHVKMEIVNSFETLGNVLVFKRC